MSRPPTEAVRTALRSPADRRADRPPASPVPTRETSPELIHRDLIEVVDLPVGDSPVSIERESPKSPVRHNGTVATNRQSYQDGDPCRAHQRVDHLNRRIREGHADLSRIRQDRRLAL